MKLAGIEYKDQFIDGGLTFVVASGAVEGDAVTITTTATVGRGSAEDPFYGKLVKVEDDDKGTVNRNGVLLVKYTGSPSVGWQELVVNGSGGVKPPAVAGTGQVYWVIGLGTIGGVNYAAIDGRA